MKNGHTRGSPSLGVLKAPWSPVGGSKYFHPHWGRRQRGSVRGMERACPLTHLALPPAAPGLTFGPSLEIPGEVP